MRYGTDLKQREAGVVPPFYELFDDVKAFCRKLEIYDIPPRPTILSKEKASAYYWSFDEENREFVQAIESDDLVGAVDAMVDMAYLAIGRVVEMGVDVELAWKSAHVANMRKERGSTDKRPGLAGVDAVKPPGWKPPDYSWLRARINKPPMAPQLGVGSAQHVAVSSTAEDAELAKKAGKSPIGLVPYEGMVQEADAFDVGKRRYSQWGYVNKPLPWSEYCHAALRHIFKLLGGQVLDDDPRNDRPITHLGCARAELGMLAVAMADHPELDDLRPIKRSVEQ